MATVTFGNVTLWNDDNTSGSGVGRVDFADRPLDNLDVSRPHPRGRGANWKKGGRGSALLVLGMTKRYSSQTGEATFRAVLDAIMDYTELKTLTVTGRTAIGNCRLVAAACDSMQPVLLGGSTVFLQNWQLVFERMR